MALPRDYRLYLVADLQQRPATLASKERRFDYMVRQGFSLARFLEGKKAAIRERREFVTRIRDAGATQNAVQNYMRLFNSLCNWQEAEERLDYRLAKVPFKRDKRRVHRAYTDAEVDALLSIPYRRTEKRRRLRALAVAHMSLGMRASELAGMLVRDLDAEAGTVFVRSPAKASWQRHLPVIEPELLHPARPLAAWIRHRPKSRSDPDALWLATRQDGAVRRLTPPELYKELRQAGNLVGVHATCNRGRHWRATSLRRQGCSGMFILDYLGDNDPTMLLIYPEADLDDLHAEAAGARPPRRLSRRPARE